MPSILDLIFNTQPETSTFTGGGMYPVYSERPVRLPSVKKPFELAVRTIPALPSGPIGAAGSLLGDTAWERISGEEIDPVEKQIGFGVNLDPSLWGDITKAGFILSGGLPKLPKETSYTSLGERIFDKPLNFLDMNMWAQKMGLKGTSPEEFTEAYESTIPQYFTEIFHKEYPQTVKYKISPFGQYTDKIDEKIGREIGKQLDAANVPELPEYISSASKKATERFNELFGTGGSYDISYTTASGPVGNIPTTAKPLIEKIQEQIADESLVRGPKLRDEDLGLLEDISSDLAKTGKVTVKELSKTRSKIGEKIGNLKVQGKKSSALNRLYGNLSETRDKLINQVDPTGETAGLYKSLDKEYKEDIQKFTESMVGKFLQKHGADLGGKTNEEIATNIDRFIRQFSDKSEVQTFLDITGQTKADLINAVKTNLFRKLRRSQGQAIRRDIPGVESYKEYTRRVNIPDQAASEAEESLGTNLAGAYNKLVGTDKQYYKNILGDEYEPTLQLISDLNLIKTHSDAFKSVVKGLDENHNLIIDTKALNNFLVQDPRINIETMPAKLKQAYQRLHKLTTKVGGKPFLEHLTDFLKKRK